MKKLVWGVLVVGLVSGSTVVAGECEYVAFPSTALGITDGEFGANTGCALAQALGLDGACIQNYRDSETGGHCVPEGLGGSGTMIDFGTNGCIGDSCDVGTVTVGEAERV